MNNSIEDMPLETRQNLDKLLTYLINYAFDHHIGVEFTKKLPSSAPSISYNEPGNLIIMNLEWLYPTQIPFQLAHEIGHVLFETEEYFHLNDLTIRKGESAQNLFAIKLLEQYCIENDICFSDCYKFAQCFGIPKECYYLLFEAIA